MFVCGRERPLLLVSFLTVLFGKLTLFLIELSSGDLVDVEVFSENVAFTRFELLGALELFIFLLRLEGVGFCELEMWCSNPAFVDQ